MTEIVFNLYPSYLGLVFKKIGRTEDALDCFHKLQAITPNNPEVLYQLADLYLSILKTSCVVPRIGSEALHVLDRRSITLLPSVKY